jgi:hypothetical protein
VLANYTKPYFYPADILYSWQGQHVHIPGVNSPCRVNAKFSQILKRALPLVPTYGFTREALARSVLSTNSSVPSEAYRHTNPLSDISVSALFGKGNDAPRVLVKAWLDDANQTMVQEFSIKDDSVSSDNSPRPTAAEIIKKRLSLNEPVLKHLPQVRIPLSRGFIESL